MCYIFHESVNLFETISNDFSFSSVRLLFPNKQVIMSSFVNKMKKQKSSSSQANAPLSTQYCPFFDTQSSNDENQFARKHSKYAVNTAATSATSMVLQSVKNKVNSCKQFQQTIAKEVKQKLKFTVDQITSVSFNF